MGKIEFDAYAGDCLLRARIDVPDRMRLTDHLNALDDLHLTDVELTALEDGRLVVAAHLVVPRSDIYAVKADDARGRREQRIRTRSSEVDMVIGPYRVQGYVHGPTAGDPVAALSRRQAMIPLTSAKIAFVLAGELHVDESDVLIVNRLLADIGTPEPNAPSILDELGLSPVDPHAKDLTAELYVDGPRNDREDRR